MSRQSSVLTRRRYKRNDTSEPMVTDQPEEPQELVEEKLVIDQPVKWETIIKTTIGGLSLSILRGPPNGVNGQWMPGSCGFFARLSADCTSPYLSHIKIDKQINAVFEKAYTQNLAQENETINECFDYGKDTVKIMKPDAAGDIHIIKNNRHLFSITKEDLEEILWWIKLMKYMRSHQDALINDEEGHVQWKQTAKTYVEIIAKLLVLLPHQTGVCECSPSDACQPQRCLVVVRKGKVVTPADQQRCHQFNALLKGTLAIPLEEVMIATRKEVFLKHLNQAVDILNKSCNWKIEKFGTDYNPVCLDQDWEMEDKRLSTIIYDLLYQNKNVLQGFQFHLKKIDL